MTDFNKILDKAKELEAKMKQSQENIKKIRVEGVSGSNSVKVTLDGSGEDDKRRVGDELPAVVVKAGDHLGFGNRERSSVNLSQFIARHGWALLGRSCAAQLSFSNKKASARLAFFQSAFRQAPSQKHGYRWVRSWFP